MWHTTSRGIGCAAVGRPRDGRQAAPVVGGRGPHSLRRSVYHATHHKTPFVTTLDSRTNPTTGETRQQLVGVSLFPLLPAVSYQIGF
jgi:hypothetical protein